MSIRDVRPSRAAGAQVRLGPRLIIVLLAVTLGLTACAGTSSSNSPGMTVSHGPGATTGGGAELTRDEWARLEEVWHLLAAKGPSVWDGWGAEMPSLLLQAQDFDYLVGHPSPPAGFESVDGLALAGEQVSRRDGHLVPGIGVQQIGDRLGVAVLPRDRLQALLDDMFGEGVIALDHVQYVRWVAHESFHVFEMTAMSGELPRFGFEGEEMDLVARLEATAGFSDRLAEEGRLLRRALESSDDANMRASGAEFLAARAERRSGLSAEIVAFEQALEWTEGLARYSDVRLLQAAAADYVPSEGYVALGATYADADTTWAAALEVLDDLSAVPGTLRDRYYELGAAEGFLLDRLAPGWHGAALPGGQSVEALLSAALSAADQGIPPTLRTLAVGSLQVSGRTYSVGIADSPDAWARGLAGVTELGSLDGLLFAFPEPVSAAFFMKGAEMPLDIAFFDETGRCVGVASMPLCRADPCPTFGASSPYRWALEAPAGTLAELTETALLRLEASATNGE